MEQRNKKLITVNLLMLVFTGLYTISPIDLIPDLIPLLGLADDGAGWLITGAFTMYTLWSLKRHGWKALRVALGPKAEGAPVIDEAEVQGAVYEPLSLEEIRAL